ncbi:MAG TPA: UDP-glucose/GDP-mannose dehydrogenase family protein [Candidatus Thermoplasmatota archaeon]|nr:UDP-glucose/GDP-mannose dehydrogenase family protein [Candidatus Thermoplasmatota archaeon]
MHCVVAGAGYVGVTTALVLVEKGHTVLLVDIDEARAHRIANAEMPFIEPGCDAALKSARASGRLSTGTDLAAACASTDVVFVCVGTPSRPNGDADLSFVKDAAKMVGQGFRRANAEPLVVMKSTVPPGTTRELLVPEIERASRKKDGQGFHGLSNPEFLREGKALEDSRNPDRLVVGASNPHAADRLVQLWGYPGVPTVRTDPTTAEFIKYAANAFLATKVSFANEMANLSSRVGVDVYDVMHGIGLDRRIGEAFLRAGAGFGGSCFPKDVRALERFAKKQGVPLRIPRAVLEINEAQPKEVVDLADRALGGLSGKSVALLGLAFKPDTDDVRETRALPIYDELVARGAKVTCWDPAALSNFKRLVNGKNLVATTDLREALRGKDVAILQTEWPQLRELPAAEWKTLMRHALVVDGRRAADGPALEAAGVRYHAIGGKNPTS